MKKLVELHLKLLSQQTQTSHSPIFLSQKNDNLEKYYNKSERYKLSEMNQDHIVGGIWFISNFNMAHKDAVLQALELSKSTHLSWFDFPMPNHRFKDPTLYGSVGGPVNQYGGIDCCAAFWQAHDTIQTILK